VRIRPLTDFLGSRIGTQAVVAAGVGFDVLKRELLTLTGEVRFLPVLTEQANVTETAGGYQSSANGKYIVPAEWMVSARTAPIEGGDLTFQLGAGGALPGGTDANGNIIVPITVPAFRIALGLTFAPRGRDTDADGVPDAVDRCPLEPGPRDSAAGMGCPL
jgi:hypothetical protein